MSIEVSEEERALLYALREAKWSRRDWVQAETKLRELLEAWFVPPEKREPQ